jgi:hypothetical protein
MFLTKQHMALLGVASIALGLAVGLVVNVQVSFAQEEIVENFTDAVVPDNNPTTPTETDLLLNSINGTIAAISTLVATVIGIVTYIVAAIRSKTGDKIISKDTENKLLDAFAQIRQKDNELRDVYRQVLEQRETINVTMDILKNTDPAVAKKLDEIQPQITQTIQNKILPQIGEWQTQADRFYETILKKEPVGSRV